MWPVPKSIEENHSTLQGRLKKHMTEDHIIVNVYNCTLCNYKSTVMKTVNTHVETNHTPPPHPNIECENCDFKSNDEKEIKIHKQTKHMSTKVDIDVLDQNSIVCEQCDYKCRYNIQMKKHCHNNHTLHAKAQVEDLNKSVVICGECASAFQDIPTCNNHIDAQHRPMPPMGPEHRNVPCTIHWTISL